MPALPIIERELRVAARNRETYWSRSGVVLGLGLLWIPGWLGTFGTATELNTFVFNGMLWAGFAVSCLACLFTADAISRERREGTLGLLFLSRVRVGDVLLGKLGSSGFKSICMLAAFLPMLMIPVLAGGVTGGEAFREGLVLLNMFWFSLCVGLWASARSSEAFNSITTACLLVGAVVFVPFLWRMAWPHYARLKPGDLEILSPLSTLFCARDAIYNGHSPQPYWISLTAVQLLGWVFLLLTGFRLRQSLRQPDSAKSRKTRSDISESAGEDFSSSVAERLAKKRVRFLHAYSNPIDWLVQHQRGVLTTLWIAAAIEVLYFASSWAVFRGMFTLGWPSVIGWVVWFAASASTDALFARAGSKFFYDSKRSGQLETLLTTPLGPRGVAEGHWSALKKLLAWPVAVGLGAMLLDEDISLITEIGQPGGYSPG
jgi:ABC-type transport system involved in cytochrome c biogenesis permease component